MLHSNRCFRLLCLMAAVQILACGCGTSDDDYVPEVDTARQSLSAALEAWKKGAATGPITTLDPPVELIDTRRNAGKKLESYEVLAEASGTQHRTFNVTMKLAGENAEETTQYFVIGINPILVYRAKDYGQPAGM